jgi:hypothetical protein
MIAGSKADSLYMTEDAFAKATGTKDKLVQNRRRDAHRNLLGSEVCGGCDGRADAILRQIASSVREAEAHPTCFWHVL